MKTYKNYVSYIQKIFFLFILISIIFSGYGIAEIEETFVVIDEIDVNEDVQNIKVDYETSETDAIAELTDNIVISDTDDVEHTVDVNWTIADYDSEAVGNYDATGTFNLPDEVEQTDPVTDLEVEAIVTVMGENLLSMDFQDGIDDGIFGAPAWASIIEITGDSYTGEDALLTTDRNQPQHGLYINVGDLSLEKEQNYEILAMVKGDEDPVNFRFRLMHEYHSGPVEQTNKMLGTEWTELTLQFTIPGDEDYNTDEYNFDIPEDENYNVDDYEIVLDSWSGDYPYTGDIYADNIHLVKIGEIIEIDEEE